jgi:hypothetical protein
MGLVDAKIAGTAGNVAHPEDLVGTQAHSLIDARDVAFTNGSHSIGEKMILTIATGAHVTWGDVTSQGKRIELQSKRA